MPCISDEGDERIMVTVSNQEDIEIDRWQVLRSIGYGTHHKLPARIVSLIDEYVENAHQLIEPSYSYIIRDIEGVRRSCVYVEGSIVFESHVIARLLEQCEKIAVFLVTIGNRLEEMVLWLAEDGLVLQSAVLDAIGSVTAEKLAESVEDRMREEACAQGLCTSRRFSPGYCDWPIRQQKMVFRAMNGASIGVRLTKECLMLPRKSVSGIIGIGPFDMEDYNPCKTCNKCDCLGRRHDTSP
ncbi:MAG TPA: hypothetical protein G4O12_05545 [Dehalococcoidia bacterium]|nr:hypothetical protein [Dehalococcoidia bacterium]